MLPLVSIPEFVQAYAAGFADIFSPPLLEHFKRYLAGLYVCERRNAQLINDTFVVKVKDQSSLNRFLTEYEWSTRDLNERRLKMLRADAQTRPRRSGVLAIDDTFNEKYGKHFEKIGHYYLPAKKKYGWAHNLVSLHYADAVCDYPLEMRLYEQMDVQEAERLLKEHGGKYKPEVLARKKSEAARRRYLGPKLRAMPGLGARFPSKIGLAKDLVDWAVEEGFTQPFVFDSWYTCRELCEHITAQGRGWIGTVAADEGVYWGGKWQSLGEWVKGRDVREFEEVKFKYGEGWERYWAGSWIGQVGKLGKVRVVASYQSRAEREQGEEPQFHVTGYLSWEKKQILQRRRRRWTIETAYEDEKGPLGFDEYEVRDIEAIKRHWYLVFAAYSASRAATAHCRFGKWINDRLKSVGDVCRQVQGEALAALISFCVMEAAQGVQMELVLKRVLSHLAR